MAAFRGTLRGHRGEASRLGNHESGIRATANSWGLEVRVEMWLEGGKGGKGQVSITVAPYQGGSSITLFSGSEARLLRFIKRRQRAAQLRCERESVRS